MWMGRENDLDLIFYLFFFDVGWWLLFGKVNTRGLKFTVRKRQALKSRRLAVSFSCCACGGGLRREGEAWSIQLSTSFPLTPPIYSSVSTCVSLDSRGLVILCVHREVFAEDGAGGS